MSAPRPSDPLDPAGGQQRAAGAEEDGSFPAVPTSTGNQPLTVDPGVEVPVPAEGEVWTVGAVILNGHGEAFAQKRSKDRRLFPDTWDIVGGHIEPGESVMGALAREIEEETGWHLHRVRRFLGVTTWTGDDGMGQRHEADYLVEVDGDLDHPALEWSRHSTYDWFGPDDLPRLTENVSPGDYLIHDLIGKVLRDLPPAPRSCR